MSTSGGFKQQCPSCEAMVPIRDSSLIGRKIDCPKCKYRFIVEEPAEVVDEDVVESAEDADEEAPKKSKGKRRRKDEEDGETPAKKKLSPKMLAYIGLGVVGVIVLIVGGYFIFGPSDEPAVNKAAASAGPGRAAQAPAVAINQIPAIQDSDSSADKGDKAETKSSSLANADALTNMLNPEAEGICTIHVQELIRTGAGRELFDSAGSFRVESLKKRLGFGLDDIELLVVSWNFTKNSASTLLHLTQPVKPDAVAAAIGAGKVADKDKIDGQSYYVVPEKANPWLDTMGIITTAVLLQTEPAKIPQRSGPLALYAYDSQTLLFGDLPAVQDFVRVKGRYKARTQESGTHVVTPITPTPAPGAFGRGIRNAGGPPTPGAAVAPGSVGRPGAGPAPAAAAAGDDADKEAEGVPSGNYLTIDPGLKRMLDRMDRKRPTMIMAVDMRTAEPQVAAMSRRSLDLKILLQDVFYFGAALRLKTGINFSLALDYSSEEIRLRRMEYLNKEGIKDLTAQLAKAFNTDVEQEDEDATPGLPGQTPGGNGVAPRRTGAGLGGFGLGPRGANPGLGGGFRGRGPGGPSGLGLGTQPGPNPAGLGNRLPGAPPLPGADEDVKESGIKLMVAESPAREAWITIRVRVIDTMVGSTFMQQRLKHLVLQQKGYLDMVGGVLRISELARAARSYPEAHQGAFPRGTADRPIPSSRAGRPYLPDQRVSWMADLLPYFGPEQQSIAARIDRTMSWKDPENVIQAATLIPQFLDPRNDPKTWWIKYPRVPLEVAATHYVGIAGVGLDAASYPGADAALASKLGVFGYDRATKLADIKDGLANTILIAEVPPVFHRPWLAGGGSTLAGVPEKQSVAPFVCTEHDGVRGTNVIMADGSARFISEKISDDVFKALCTVRGGEQINLNKDAPLLGESTSELKASAPPKQ